MASLSETAVVFAIVAVLVWWGGRLVVPAYDLFFAVAVLLFAAQRRIVSDLLRARPMLFAGSVSYSLYAVHGLVLTLFMLGVDWLAADLGYDDAILTTPRVNRAYAGEELGWLADGIVVLAVLACLAAAWVLFRLVEHPARQWSRRQVLSP